MDNRRSNLRLATQSQNNANIKKTFGTSVFKGVCWDKSRLKWHAQIQFNGKRYHLGRFTSEEDAAAAYDSAAIRMFGEFARPNFPI